MNTPALVRAAVQAIAALCLLGPVARAATPEGFSLGIMPDTLRADDDGVWDLGVRFANGTNFGVHGDSLLLVVTPAGATAGGAVPTIHRLLVPAPVASMSAGDSVTTQVRVGATSKVARLEVRFHWHDVSGAAFTSTANALASGSTLDGHYPPTLARIAGRDVELVKVPAAAGSANGGGVLLLPGEDSDAEAMLVPAARLARVGVSVVIVNAPGRGRSQGTDDFAGPASRAAALAALDTLLRMPGVERSQVGAWGVSRGATLALLVALEKPGAFAAVAAQSASYDLWASHRAASPAARTAIEAAAGRDSAQWRARSPLLQQRAPGPIVLVLHGEQDEVFPVAPARAFAASLKDSGGRVVERLLPRGRHTLAPAEAIRFLQAELKRPE